MIELGLVRIGRLLQHTKLPWRAIHVAGTNGKGSVCSYVFRMLNAGKINSGIFTSPHLINRWDCIRINQNIVNKALFDEVEAEIKARDEKERINASEFELLTATAFEIFTRSKVQIGVVEVGMGGSLDATNILQDPLVTVITRIGQDHEAYLGNTLTEIAGHKAGIMKSGVPCVYDGNNLAEVHRVVIARAKAIGNGSPLCVPQDCQDDLSRIWKILPEKGFAAPQKTNLQLAFMAVIQALSRIGSTLDPSTLLPGLERSRWPGRLQWLTYCPVPGKRKTILLDGAHNPQSATALADFVDVRRTKARGPVTWVVAVSKGKPLEEILLTILRPKDHLVAVEFGPVDGMPWVHATKSADILRAAEHVCQVSQTYDAGVNVEDALKRAAEIASGGLLVVAGSLYLVSDVLRTWRVRRVETKKLKAIEQYYSHSAPWDRIERLQDVRGNTK